VTNSQACRHEQLEPSPALRRTLGVNDDGEALLSEQTGQLTPGAPVAPASVSMMRSERPE
jgi:hypothetical protein